MNAKAVVPGVAILTALAAAAGREVVNESFTGEQFPPAGWYILYEQGWWSRAEVNGDYYADGRGHASNGGAASYLYSKTFNLTSSGKINIQFNYYAGEDGFNGVNVREVHLERAGEGLWEDDFPTLTDWRHYDKTVGPFPKASGYRLYFEVGATGFNYYAHWCLFGVDDVYVRECYTDVAPASLGRVKALLR